MVEIAFDPEREQQNRRKHGLDFSLAPRVLHDPLAMTAYDRFEGGEHRWYTMAAVGHAGKVLVVIHTDPTPDDGGPLRIIGMRQATSHERRRYEDSTD